MKTAIVKQWFPLIAIYVAICFSSESSAARAEQEQKCTVIGDSIGVGMAKALPNCEVDAVSGISPAKFDRRFEGSSAALTVISLGQNDGPDNREHLESIRAKIAGRVVWLLPPVRARDVVAAVAAEHKDRVVDVLESDATPAHTHPSTAGYLKLKALIDEDATLAP